MVTQEEAIKLLVQLGADFSYRMDKRAGDAANLTSLALAAHKMKLSSVRTILMAAWGGLDGELNGYCWLSSDGHAVAAVLSFIRCRHCCPAIGLMTPLLSCHWSHNATAILSLV
jgi:hypothetical protein